MATVENFKELFNRGEFSYLPLFDANKNYMKLDEVYAVNGKFYTSNIDYNEGNEPTQNLTLWTLTADRIEDYILDSDIQRAMIEAEANFNKAVFESDELRDLAFYYLMAHYLWIDTKNASNNGTSTGNIVAGKSVGNVSITYAVPQKYLNNPYIAFLNQSGFGNKYLSFLLPRMVARCMWVMGRSLP